MVILVELVSVIPPAIGFRVTRPWETMEMVGDWVVVVANAPWG